MRRTCPQGVTAWWAMESGLDKECAVKPNFLRLTWLGVVGPWWGRENFGRPSKEGDRSLLPTNILLRSSCRATLFAFSLAVFLSPRLLLGIVVSVRAGRWSRVIDCAGWLVRHLARPLRPPPRVIVAALRRGISDILRSSAAGRFDKVSPACSNGSDCETVRLPSPFLPATAQCDPHALFQRYAA